MTNVRIRTRCSHSYKMAEVIRDDRVHGKSQRVISTNCHEEGLVYGYAGQPDTSLGLSLH